MSAPLFRPHQLDFLHVTVSPLITVFDRGQELERHLNSEMSRLIRASNTSAELEVLVQKEIGYFDLGIMMPMRAVFIDGENGVETPPEWADYPILLISLQTPDADWDFLPTMH